MDIAFDPLAGMRQPIAPRTSERSRPPTILVFDSGLGGLTVYRELARSRPDATFVYCADDAAFPYGRLTEADLVDRVVKVMDRLIDAHDPDCVVIACNTASTLVLPALRSRFAVPFVGTVPAIKPACERSKTRMVSVLATPGTVARDYTRALVAEFGAGCAVTLVGSPDLANLAEAAMRGTAVDEDAIAAQIAPCFVTRADDRTDTVVLACTHYPLLLESLRKLSPWPVEWVDPAAAIARRMVQIIGPAASGTVRPAMAILTGGEAKNRLAPIFSGFGFREILVEPLPLH